MFSVDIWQEILNTIKQNKLRTFLTGFSVAWGIYMLIILLACGNGFQHAIEYGFRSSNTSSVWINTRFTSIGYKGYKPGRRIQMTNDDYAILKSKVKEIGAISSRYGFQGEQKIRYKSEVGSYEIRTIHPDYLFLEGITMISGRFVNTKDINEFRKVGIISTDIRDFLFKHENPIGKYIYANGIALLVVGVFEDKDSWDNNKCIYMPVSSAQKIFGVRDVQTISVCNANPNATAQDNVEMEKKIRDILNNIHAIDPKDESALDIFDVNEAMTQTKSLINGIKSFIWIIGVMTILAGIVGVSNIMMIVVKERTKEIGIRKAIGAKPWSIISLILQESILITSIAGYIGLVLGVGTIELVNSLVPENDFFKNPSVDINIAITATIILIVSGAIAGFIPANKAAQIKPIVALRDE